jgi:hypothetical protein
MNASVYLGESLPNKAVASLTHSDVTDVISRPEWTTMALAVYFKLGVSNLCFLNFSAAHDAFNKAGNTIEATNKWNYIPFMRTLEGMSFLASVQNVTLNNIANIRSIASKIFAPTFIDHDMSDNPILLPGDYWGSRMGYEYGCLLMKSSDDELVDFFHRRTPFIDILYGMVTCLYCFDKVDPTAFREADIQAIKMHASKRSLLVLGEYYRKIGRYNDSVSFFDDAIELCDSNECDCDSILPFSLVFQGASLCSAGDPETAREVLADLDSVLKSYSGGKISKTLFGQKIAINHYPIKPGNLVNVDGGELDIMLNFRRNALKQKIDSGFVLIHE